MTCELPFPVAELRPLEPLMDVAEIEEFAPAISCELSDDTTLADALCVPGGLAIYCHQQRLRDEAAGIVAVNTRKKRSDEHESS